MNNAHGSGSRRFVQRGILIGMALLAPAACSIFEYPQALNNPADPDLRYRYIGELDNRFGPESYAGVPRPRDAEWHAASNRMFFVSDITSRLYAQGTGDPSPESLALPIALEPNADLALWNDGQDLHVFVGAGQALLRVVIAAGQDLAGAEVSEVNLGSEWDADILDLETLNDAGDLYMTWRSSEGVGILQYDPAAETILISRPIPEITDIADSDSGGFAVTDNYLAVSRQVNGILRINRAGFSAGGDYDPWTFTESGGTITAAAGEGGARGWPGAIDHIPGSQDQIVALIDDPTVGPGSVIDLANTATPLVSAEGNLASYQTVFAYVETVPVAARGTSDYLVADGFQRLVRDLAADTVALTWPDPPAGAFAGPLLVTSDEIGNVFIYDNFLGSVVRIDPDGTRTRVIPLNALGIVSTISAREGRFALYEESGIDQARLYDYGGAPLETWTPPDLGDRRLAVAPIDPGLPLVYWLSTDSSTAELTPLQGGGSLGATVSLQTGVAFLEPGASAVVAGQGPEVFVGLTSESIPDDPPRESGVFLANFTSGALTPVLGSLQPDGGVGTLDPSEPTDNARVPALAYRAGFIWALIDEFAAAVRLTPQGDIRGSLSVGADTSGLGTWTRPGTVINRQDFVRGTLAVDGNTNLLFAEEFDGYIQVFEAY